MLLIEEHHLVGGLVTGVVLQKDRSLTPVWVLLIKHPDEGGEEKLHHV